MTREQEETFWSRNQSWLLRVIPTALGIGAAFAFGAAHAEWPIDVLAGIAVAVLVVAIELQWFIERTFDSETRSLTAFGSGLDAIGKEIAELKRFDNQIQEFNRRLAEIPSRTSLEQNLAHRALNLAAEDFKIPEDGPIYAPGQDLSIRLYKYFWNEISRNALDRERSFALTTHASDLRILEADNQLLLNLQKRFIDEGGAVFRILVDRENGKDVDGYLRNMQVMVGKGIVPVYLCLAELQEHAGIEYVDRDLCLISDKFALCWKLDNRGGVLGSEFVEGGMGFGEQQAYWDTLYQAVKNSSYASLGQAQPRLDAFRAAFVKAYEPPAEEDENIPSPPRRRRARPE